MRSWYRARLVALLAPGHLYRCSLGIKRKRYLDANEKVPVRQPLGLAERIPAKAVALGHSSLRSPWNDVLIASKANHMQPAKDQRRADISAHQRNTFNKISPSPQLGIDSLKRRPNRDCQILNTHARPTTTRHATLLHFDRGSTPSTVMSMLGWDMGLAIEERPPNPALKCQTSINKPQMLKSTLVLLQEITRLSYHAHQIWLLCHCVKKQHKQAAQASGCGRLQY